MRRRDKNKFLLGGLGFDGKKARPLKVSANAPVDSASESDHQKAFFAILAINQPKPPLKSRVKKVGGIITEPVLDAPSYVNHPFYIFTRVRHFPNGGFRHVAVARNLKAEGVSPGALDIYLDAARLGCHGLRIELKAHNRKASEFQKEERRWLEKEGYSHHICWHWLEALEILCRYCGILPLDLRGYPHRTAIRLPTTGHDEMCGCGITLGLDQRFDKVVSKPAGKT
jgi:hypothetical protein